MLAIFAETSYNAHLDPGALKKICKFFVDLAPQRRADFHVPTNIIDPDILVHHIRAA